VGDLNGDQNPDIVTRNGDDTLSVLLGNADGTFTPDPNLGALPVGSGLADLAIADFNGDGKLDIAVAEEFENVVGSVSILLGGRVNPPATPTLPPTLTPIPTLPPTASPTRTGTPSPTPTPTPNRTGSPTITPTRTPTRTPRSAAAGDADCSGTVNDAD